MNNKALFVALPPQDTNTVAESIVYETTTITTHSRMNNPLMEGISNWLLPPANAATTTEAAKPPTDSEVKLLRDSLGALYGERNPEKAEGLLTQAIDAWERQAPDEKAALYRVRGDCYMQLLRAEDAVKDYTTTIDFLKGPGGEGADPGELPAATLGRARALRGMTGKKLSIEEYKQMAEDYQISLRLTSGEEWDTNEENEADGATRNPYAAWEWGMAKRASGDFKGAAETHSLASLAFKNIGDKARAVISSLDTGIDLAATDNVEEAKKVLNDAIQSTTSVEGRDIELLQRVIAKEAEARVALASVYWGNNERAAAEAQLGEACSRLDQLQVDADAREAARVKSGAIPPITVPKLRFTIDDTAGAELSCSRFKNEKFISETLLWPSTLQDKVSRLNKLK